MKNLILKIVLISLFSSIISFNNKVFSQSVCANANYNDLVKTNSDWNWWDPVTNNTCKNWLARTGPNQYYPLPNPFYDAEQIEKIKAINKDFKPSQGWVLLKRDFGIINIQKFPYFILYNKYAGIIRVFSFLNNAEGTWTTGYSMTLKILNNVTNSSVSSFSLEEDYSQEQYRANPDLSNEVSVYVGGKANVNNWIMGEFYLGLDTDINNERLRNSEFVINVESIIYSDIKASINGESTTKDFQLYGKEGDGKMIESKQENVNGALKTVNKINGAFAKGAKGINNFNDGLKKMGDAAKAVIPTLTKLKDLETVSVWMPPLKTDQTVDIKQVADTKKNNSIDGINKTLQFLSTFSTETKLGQSIQAVAKTVPVLSTALSVTQGVVGMFSKNTSSLEPPLTRATFTGYDLKLEGSITTSFLLYSISLYIPGTPHDLSKQELVPYYDCALGVISLDNTPILEKTDFINQYFRYRSIKGANSVSTSNDRNNLLIGASLNETAIASWVYGFKYGFTTINGEFANRSGYNSQGQRILLQPEIKNLINFSSYRLTNDLNMTVNQTLGFENREIMGAIIAEIDMKYIDFNEYQYKNVHTTTSVVKGPNIIRYFDIEQINPLMREINKGNIIVYSEDKINNKLIVGTPMTSIKDMKGLALNVPFDSKVYIKLSGKLSSNNLPEDFLFSKNYSVVKVQGKNFINQNKFLNSDEYPYNNSTNSYTSIIPWLNIPVKSPIIKSSDYDVAYVDVDFPNVKLNYNLVSSNYSNPRNGTPELTSVYKIDENQLFYADQTKSIVVDAHNSIYFKNCKFTQFNKSYPEYVTFKGLGSANRYTGVRQPGKFPTYKPLTMDLKTLTTQTGNRPYTIVSGNYIYLDEGVEINPGTEVEFIIYDTYVPTYGFGEIKQFTSFYCANGSYYNPNSVVGREGIESFEENNTINNKFSFSPNPSDGNIILTSLSDTKTHYIIYNTSGKLIIEGDFVNEQHLNLKDIGRGLFLIKFVSGNESKTEKLLIN